MNLKFEQIFEHNPVAMMLVNRAGRITLVNQYTEILFEYDRSELIGEKVEILVPETIKEKHPTLVQSFFNSPIARRMGAERNLFGIRKDGSQIPIEVGLNPIESEGELFVLSSVIDISERLKAEERFRAAFEAAPNGMVMVNHTGVIILVNHKVEEIFGYERNELLNQPIETLVPEGFRGPHPNFVASYVRNPEPRAMGTGRDLFGRHKSGKLIAVEIGLQPVYSREGTVVISSVVDITRRKAAEEEIKNKSAELEDFAYRTSHDLKSPLLSIRGIADCIIEDISDANYDEATRSANKIRHLSGKLQDLIQDILMLTKLEASHQPTSKFDFSIYLALALEKFDQLISDNGVRLEASLGHKKDLIVQPVRLTQILDNLISNGIKYCNPKREKRFVKLLTFTSVDRFFIQVEDNGVGIPENRHQEVFGMFKRFHGKSISGSGLGLYLLKKQVAKLGAQIKFESSEKGTTFYLDLPVL